MPTAFNRCVARYRGTGGLLVFLGMAVIAVAVERSWTSPYSGRLASGGTTYIGKKQGRNQQERHAPCQRNAQLRLCNPGKPSPHADCCGGLRSDDWISAFIHAGAPRVGARFDGDAAA